MAMTGAAKEPPTELKVLERVSGVIKPGTLSLVIAPPGHSKSAYLKMLTQLLPARDVRGTVTYSGVSQADAAAAGVHLGQIAQYVSQLDEHIPFLTVRETFEFIHANATVDPAKFGHTDLAAKHVTAVDDIIHLLHLRNCETTVVGNDLLRGVSGGEKKRVTVGEGLLTNARFLALDEISTGLDSAVTLDIIRSLKARAIANGLTVVIAMLQPAPEVYACFDDVILLREGTTVYHGPRDELPKYLAGLGFRPPHAALAPAGGIPLERAVSTGETKGDAQAGGGVSLTAGEGSGGPGAPAQSDMADWLVDLLTNPGKTFARDELAAHADSLVVAAAEEATVPRQDGPSPAVAVVVDDNSIAPKSVLPVSSDPHIIAAPAASSSTHVAAATPAGIAFTTAGLADAWRASALYEAQMSASPTVPKLTLEGDYARAQYGHAYPHSVMKHMAYLVGRQFIMMKRNAVYIRSRLVTTLFLSFVLGGLYYQRSLNEGITFYGTFLNTCMVSLVRGLCVLRRCYLLRLVARAAAENCVLSLLRRRIHAPATL